jgi:hypothetical protein
MLMLAKHHTKGRVVNYGLSKKHDSAVILPLPQSVPRREREDKPFSLRGKGGEGGNTVAYYGNVNKQKLDRLC